MAPQMAKADPGSPRWPVSSGVADADPHTRRGRPGCGRASEVRAADDTALALTAAGHRARRHRPARAAADVAGAPDVPRSARCLADRRDTGRRNLTGSGSSAGYTRAVPRLMLLDAHSLIYRAYFALIDTPLSTSKGQLVNAAFGFWSIVLRGFQDAQPDHVICCFDVGRPKRADMYGAYKGTRRPHAGRPARPVPHRARDARRVPHPDLRPGRLRGGRPHRHAQPPGAGAGHRFGHRVGRPGHAPARVGAHDADVHAHGRGRHDHVRPGPDPRAIRPPAAPDDRLQGAQGRHDRQHPGAAGRRRQDRRQAARGLRLARRRVRASSTRSSRTSCATSSSTTRTTCCCGATW